MQFSIIKNNPPPLCLQCKLLEFGDSPLDPQQVDRAWHSKKHCELWTPPRYSVYTAFTVLTALYSIDCVLSLPFQPDHYPQESCQGQLCIHLCSFGLSPVARTRIGDLSMTTERKEEARKFPERKVLSPSDGSEPFENIKHEKSQ